MSRTPINELQLCGVMLFFFHSGINATKATNAINLTYPGALQVRKCQLWFGRFREGNFNLNDEERSGRISHFDDDLLMKEVEENPAQILEELAEKLDHSVTTVFEHLRKLGKSNRAGKWVPHNLNAAQRAKRVTYCQNLLNDFKNDEPMLDRIITCDEKWVNYDNPKRRKQWLSRGEKPRTTPMPALHGKKALLCVWWCTRGIIYSELLLPGQTINANLYSTQLESVQEALKTKFPSLHNRQDIILHHDNGLGRRWYQPIIFRNFCKLKIIRQFLKQTWFFRIFKKICFNKLV